MDVSFKNALMQLSAVELLDDVAAAGIYGADTGASPRLPAGAIVVKSAEVVRDIILIANKHGATLWPISGGRNFGYGTSLPANREAFILDLSGLRKVSIDVESCTALIEPGVTQADLHEAIKQSGAALLVPTTGVGHNGSILGNALDGGYGLTPITDHFDALSEIEGYWGDGSSFRHVYQDLGCPEMARRWRAGTGQFWAGLLRQGSVGVATRARVQLARAPEATRILIFEWKNDEDFFASQHELNRLCEDIPGIGGIIMMNDYRILSTQLDTPLVTPLRGEARLAHFKQLAKERKIKPWTALGTLYGSRASVAGAVRDVKRRLKGCRVWSFSPAEIKLLQQIESSLPKIGFKALRRHLGALVNTLGTVEGYPIVGFLKIAYALNPNVKKLDISAHPAKDGVGILWYAPFVPFTPEDVTRYRDVMSACLMAHGFDPLLAVTSRDSRTLSGTIPLLFDRANMVDVARAKSCYRALVQTGLENGWPPYRIGIDYMDMIACDADSASATTQARIKMALDPNGVISSGRYGHKTEIASFEMDDLEALFPQSK